MKRIVAAFVVAVFAGWSGAQINGLGGIYINGVLQGAIGSGTVTSVGLNLASNASSIFTVGNTPVTTSGNFLFGFANVSAGAALLGPVSGANAAPAFRLFVSTDLASPDASGCLGSNGAGILSWVTCGGAGANAALSNLAPTAVNESIIPASDNSIDLGSADHAWHVVYSNILYSGVGGSIGIEVIPANQVASTLPGRDVTITASPASAGLTNPGAEAGGSVILTAGDAARKTSGNANGGDIRLMPGTGIGSGIAGKVLAGPVGGITDIAGLRFDGSQYAGYWIVYPATFPGTDPGPLVQIYQGAVNSYGPNWSWHNSAGDTVQIGGDPGGSGSFIHGIRLSDNSRICWHYPNDTCIERSAAGAFKATDGSTGLASWTASSYKLFDGGTHYTTMQAQTQAGDVTYTLPAAHGTGYLYDNGAGALAWNTPAVTAHEILSTTHGDTTAAAVQRGDIIIGSGATPKWTRLGKGTQNYVLTMGTDEPGWAAAAGGGANTALSNLSSVLVNLALTPGTDNSIALNSSAKRFTSGFFSTDIGVYAAASDAHPTSALINGGVALGAGGSNAKDTCMERDSAGVFKLTDCGSGSASMRASAVNYYDGAGHYTAFQAQTQTGNITWTLPPVANVSGTLRNDGTGTLTWYHGSLVDEFSYTFFDLNTDLPNTLDIPSIRVNRAKALHIVEVFCEVAGGTATINLTKNGSNIGTADITCATTPSGTDGTTGILDNSGTHFVSGTDAIAVGDKIGHLTQTVGAGLRRMNVVVTYTID